MKKTLTLVLVLALSGCAMFRDLAEPEVELTSISVAPASGFTQLLQVGVRVRNPNAFALKLANMDYRIFLEGAELARGNYRDVLEVAAYDSSEFTVPVELNLLSGFSLIQKLINNPQNELEYRLRVDANVTTMGIGRISVVKSEKIQLTH